MKLRKEAEIKIAGTSYDVMTDGSYRRVSPIRPYRGKSERRQVIKDRRARKAQ